MFNIERIKTTIKPNKFESLGNGIWYYNYDVKESTLPGQYGEDELVYDFVQVRIPGKPTYDTCVKALIRAYVDTNSELDLINSYNAYLLDVDSSLSEYEEYLSLIKEIKQNVSKDFSESHVKPSGDKPKQSDIMKLMLMTINTMALTDQQSLSVKSLYPNWGEFIGLTLKKDFKVLYGDKLFKVVQEHLVQELYPPSIDTASLYTEIVEDHAGTLEDPIPYPSDGNMIIYNGKYYIEDDIIYLCIRDSQQPLYTALANVVGNYVQVV